MNPFFRGTSILVRRIEGRADIHAEVALQLRGAVVHCAAEGRLDVVELPAHAQVLRPLAREKEGDL